MARRNHRGGRPQARRREFGPVGFRPPPPPVEKAVIPHGRCHFRHGKLKFHAHEVARALKEAQALRRAKGQEMHMEKRFYECEKDKGGCGAWHLTSRETWENR